MPVSSNEMSASVELLRGSLNHGNYMGVASMKWA